MRLQRRTSEAGESLVEIVVAVAILGLGVVALLGGLGTAVSTSGLHRRQADVSAVLTAASERVKLADYMACAGAAEYLDSPATFAYPGFDRTDLSFTIRDWNGVAFVPRDATTCRQLEDLGYREQLVTLTVVGPAGNVSQTLPIVKRFRDCPNPASPTDGCDA